MSQMLPYRPRTSSIMLWIVAVGFFMQTLDTTIVNTALPSMARSLGESPLRMQSVVIAYSLTMAMLIPATGWIADKLGTTRVFISAIGLFMLGSIGCAASSSLDMLVMARVVQGLGGAMLMPVGRLALLRTVPADQFLRAMSFVAVPGLIGPLIGPTLGGWLVSVASWHWIFLINVPVGIAGIAATYYFMIDSRAAVKRFDLKGYLLLAVGMVTLSLSLDGLTDLGLQHATVLVLLVISFATWTAYGLHATRAPFPLFPLYLFKIHSYSVGLLGNLFCRIGTGAMPYLIPLLLQVSLGYEPFHAGLMMLPVAAAGMGAKRLASPLIVRFGYRGVLIGNTVAVGLMMASFGFVTPTWPIAILLCQLAVFGAVNSLQFTAMNTLTLKDLARGGASSGNGLFSMVQMLAMSLGVTVGGALLDTFQSWVHGVPDARGSLPAFHWTFACVGIITAASSWIFAQLAPQVRHAPTDHAAHDEG
ncbi:EmrB/QacA subfamily drug resistance transporter [Robbsia andropogonis]|uniref:EmrB/QacA subfamily drug resistance transporter n=1 Tax=Robbsia andropogonis TaxID=28092 RepID=A0A0F5JW79_9BURK|nr:multidrug transporter subunit MdtD [Robbsia andropogonis]KKB62091.1 EmrB/QacA subfamily drug resistance transporter [Robbsia andropogonis]